MMVLGGKYRFQYRQPGHRIAREAVAQFLGSLDETHMFSARPISGTFRIPQSWMLTTPEEVNIDTEPYVDRPV